MADIKKEKLRNLLLPDDLSDEHSQLEMCAHPPHLAHLTQTTHSDRKWIKVLFSPMRTSPQRISIICMSTDLMEIVAAASSPSNRPQCQPAVVE